MAIAFDLLPFFIVCLLMAQFSPPASCVMMHLKVVCHIFCPSVVKILHIIDGYVDVVHVLIFFKCKLARNCYSWCCLSYTTLYSGVLVLFS
uniref:Putative secreted protein n=1 Tax=Amblyomma cajennense TaxID=34607 RepID=A0A023FBF8_AMBCJ